MAGFDSTLSGGVYVAANNGHMKNLYCKMIVVLFIVVLTCLTGAVSFAGQAPPISDSNPIQAAQWPDLYDPRTTLHQRLKSDNDPVIAGDPISIACECIILGCVVTQFSASLYIDNILFTEKRQFAPVQNKIPGLCENYASSYSLREDWEATPGNHTIKCIFDSQKDILSQMNSIIRRALR